MSFLGRLFGSVSAEPERKRADALFAEGRFYDAKTAYESAASAKDATDAIKKTCAEKIDACSDALAEARIAQAEKHLSHGDLDLARTELANAMEVAASEAVRRKAEGRLDRAERKDARAQAEEDDGPTGEERLLLLAAKWEEPQQEEYDAYGEDFRSALVGMETGEHERAREMLERIAKEHAEGDVPPCYLYLEIARARMRCEDFEATAKALRTFLKRVPEDDRSEARVNAYAWLAQLADEAGDEEKATKQLSKAVEAMPDDPRPDLNLGQYLRTKGHPEEAIELLELGIQQIEEDRPSWAAYQELALAQRDAGNVEKAIDLLEKVIRVYVQRGTTDLPPTAAYPLAELHEKRGNFARAADLYTSLARGTDKAGHLAYHRAAARVLEKLDLVEEARRMLMRAAALAEGNAELEREIEAAIAKLDEE
jgi:tetratricopeptide (TPR) repeat protein